MVAGSTREEERISHWQSHEVAVEFTTYLYLRPTASAMLWQLAVGSDIHVNQVKNREEQQVLYLVLNEYLVD